MSKILIMSKNEITELLKAGVIKRLPDKPDQYLTIKGMFIGTIIYENKKIK